MTDLNKLLTSIEHVISSQLSPSQLSSLPMSNPGLAAYLCTEELIKFNKAPTKFNEALAKPYHGLKEVLL